VEDFWSVMVYDAETRSMIVNNQVPERDSNAKIITNDDGSVDLYFGPKAPKGKEANWVKTNPGKVSFYIFAPMAPKRNFSTANGCSTT
jgi:hypothetical protein